MSTEKPVKLEVDASAPAAQLVAAAAPSPDAPTVPAPDAPAAPTPDRGPPAGPSGGEASDHAAAGKPEPIVEGLKPYSTTQELVADLMIIYHSLHKCGDGILAEGRLKDLLRRAYCFGLSLTRLDIRQVAHPKP